MEAVSRLALTLLAATCALGLTACGGGGGGGSSAEATTTTTTRAARPTKTVGVDVYAGSVCSALSTWLNNLANASTVFANSTNAESDLRKVRADFVTFFGGAIQETDRMVAQVEAAGVPKLPKGPQVSDSLLRELAEFKPLLVEAQGRARRLPVEKPARFTKQAQTLGAGFRIETTKLETVFDVLAQRFREPQLARAAAADANCRDLQP
jgi:hypothetical protein